MTIVGARRIASIGLLAALLLALAALIGCTSDPYVELHAWSLRAGELDVPVTLPGVLEARLPNHPASYVLTTQAPLDDAFRGRDLSLVLPSFHAMGELVVDGERIEPIEVSPFDRDRRSQRIVVYRLPARLTDRARLPLRLELENRSWLTSRFAVAPRIVAAPNGGRPYEQIVIFNRATMFGALAISAMLAIACGLVFVINRSRRADGWFALFAASVFVWHLQLPGFTQILG
ncbi:MAG: hypothetical protein ACHREM_28125, partial [Polyangiales bacterium]